MEIAQSGLPLVVVYILWGKPHNGPSAALVLIAIINNVVQESTGFSGFGKKIFHAEYPQIYCYKVYFEEGGLQIS